jgi:transposase-like protein
MAQYKITIDESVMQQLFTRDNGLAVLAEEVVNQVLEAQVSEHLKAGWHERTQEREGYRNGYRERQLKTRVGELNLEVPRVRSGHFSPDFFVRYQRSEQALLLAMVEMVVNGVSTRKVRAVVQELCGTEFSRSTVSELCKNLDGVVGQWKNRELGEYPFLMVDAMVIRVRKGGQVRLSSALIATGISREGYREILGLALGDSETEAIWAELFDHLKARGLRGVDLVVSDDHKGLKRAVETRFQGATWQRCQTHFTRNILDGCPKALQGEFHGKLRLIFEAPDMVTARRLLEQVLQDYAGRAPKAVRCLEDGFEDAMAVMALPERYRKRLRTTNGVERLNQEVRRRERVIRIFPNEDSALRLIGAFLMEIDERWSTGNRYFDMSEYLEWKNSQAAVSSDANVTQAA